MIPLKEAISIVCVIGLPAFPQFLVIQYTHNTDTVFLALFNIHKKGNNFFRQKVRRTCSTFEVIKTGSGKVGLKKKKQAIKQRYKLTEAGLH